MTFTTVYRAPSMIDGYIVEGQTMKQIIEISKGDRNVRQLNLLFSYIYEFWKAAQEFCRYRSEMFKRLDYKNYKAKCTTDKHNIIKERKIV